MIFSIKKKWIAFVFIECRPPEVPPDLNLPPCTSQKNILKLNTYCLYNFFIKCTIWVKPSMIASIKNLTSFILSGQKRVLLFSKNNLSWISSLFLTRFYRKFPLLVNMQRKVFSQNNFWL